MGKGLLPVTGKEKLIRKTYGSVHVCLIKKGGCSVCFGQKKENTGCSITARRVGDYSKEKSENPVQETVRKTRSNQRLLVECVDVGRLTLSLNSGNDRRCSWGTLNCRFYDDQKVSPTLVRITECVV